MYGNYCMHIIFCEGFIFAELQVGLREGFHPTGVPVYGDGGIMGVVRLDSRGLPGSVWYCNKLCTQNVKRIQWLVEVYIC